MVVTETIELPDAIYKVRNSILRIQFRTKQNADFTKDSINAHLQAYKSIRKTHKALPTLIDARDTSKEVKENILRFFARQTMSRKERHGPRAYLISSFAERLLINFYLRMVDCRYPVEIFLDEQKALEWLEEHKSV